MSNCLLTTVAHHLRFCNANLEITISLVSLMMRILAKTITLKTTISTKVVK